MHVVIIGSGVAGICFAEKFRVLTRNEITLVTQEHDGYYSRPLLSRGFSRTDIEQSILLKSVDKLREGNINVLSGGEVTAIDRTTRTIAIQGSCQEKSLQYDQLILALGSAAFIPPPFRAYQNLFHCLNSLDDLRALRKFRRELINQSLRPSWAVIGGGLIGCELASDLAIAGDDVTLYHAMDRLMERQLVEEDSELLLKVLQETGIRVLLNQSVKEFIREEDKICVRSETTAEFDGLVVSCGFKPRTELAEQAGLAVARGINVNHCLQTSDPFIYALGDVAELPDGKLYPFILPIRSQALWLAEFLANQSNGSIVATEDSAGWRPPVFTTKAKVHGFEAVFPYKT